MSMRNWQIGNYKMYKPWARPIAPLTAAGMFAAGLWSLWVVGGIVILAASGKPSLLCLAFLWSAWWGWFNDDAWVQAEGKSMNPLGSTTCFLVYTALFPWYILGYYRYKKWRDEEVEAHYFDLAGSNAWWYVRRMNLPKPWRRPDHDITKRERVLAVAGFALAPLYVTMVLITLAGAVYVLVTGEVGGLAVAVVVWYAAVLKEAHGIWQKVLRDRYHEGTKDSSRREKVLSWLVCWLLLAFVYLPFDFLTWERWRRKWNF